MHPIPDPLLFQWDDGNREKSKDKHNVWYYECEEAFEDTKKIVLDDIQHSEKEARYILLGKTRKSRHLFLVFTLRESGILIRVISARDINKKELAFYEKS